MEWIVLSTKESGLELGRDGNGCCVCVHACVWGGGYMSECFIYDKVSLLWEKKASDYILVKLSEVCREK